MRIEISESVDLKVPKECLAITGSTYSSELLELELI